MKRIAAILTCLFLLVGCQKSNSGSELGYYVQDSFSRNVQSLAYCDGCLPSIGSPKMLVLAIDFPNRRASTYGYHLSDVEAVFDGTSEETGWESVRTYYEKSSYGALNLDIDVLGWYRAKNFTGYYENLGADTGSEALIKEALQYYEGTIDLSVYDSNDDTYIDSLFVIYSQSISNTNSLWWAYQSYYVAEDYFDGVTPYYYAFASIQFAFITPEITYDARTYIHETGHLLGLEDYYDYDEETGPPNGLGCADMMDDTRGDHNPFSKMLLGWVYPTIVNPLDEVEITLEPFQQEGDFLILANNWKASMFSEYFVIQYFTPTSLQALDPFFTTPGVLVYHVAASLTGSGDNQAFLYNNSYTSHKVISIIEADGGVDSAILDNNALYATGSNFNIDTPIYYYNFSTLQYSMEVGIMDENGVHLTFSLLNNA